MLYRYFVFYYTEFGDFGNCEISSHTFLLSWKDIKEIEARLERDKGCKVRVANFTHLRIGKSDEVCDD